MLERSCTGLGGEGYLSCPAAAEGAAGVPLHFEEGQAFPDALIGSAFQHTDIACWSDPG